MLSRIIILVLFAFTVYAQDAEPETYNLRVEFTGINNDTGVIMAALVNSQDNYDNNEMFIGKAGIISNGSSEILFENIPAGMYAVKAYHDENENGELDTNFLGIPSEDYGFSNDARGSFGPPSWEDASFMLESNKEIKINLD